MRWFRDTQAPRGPWLRTLLVLGLVVAVVAETPLRAVDGFPTWLTLGGTGTVAGSLPPPPNASEAPELAAAKGKNDTKRKDKRDKNDKKGKHQEGGKGKNDKNHKKSKHNGGGKGKDGGKGKHPGDGKRDTSKSDQDPGAKKGKQHDTRRTNGKDQKTLVRRAASDGTAAATTSTFAPVADTQVKAANPDFNYGTQSQLLVDGGTDRDVASYLRFDVSGVSASVQKATLRLFVRNNGATKNGPFVQATGTSWKETELTWNTRPEPSGAVLDDPGALADSTWVEYTVTPAVTGNGPVAFVLLPQSTDGAIFHSREGANPPQLVLTVGSTTPPPTPTSEPNPPPTAPLTVPPVADAQVNEANPATNYGTLAQLLVDGGTDPDVASYLHFDLSGVNAPVQRATLRLWVQTTGGGTQDGPSVQTSDTSWSETGLTWSTRPGPSGAVLDDPGVLAASTWAEYDVTAAVQGDGAVAFVLLAQSNDGVIFDSREAANPPQLVLTFAGGAPPPTATPPPTPTATAVPTSTPRPTATPTPTATPPPGGSATLLAAGDIASCSSNGDEATAALLDGRAGTVAALGDLAYESGTASEFTQCYTPSWGRHKSRTRPAAGNHEYITSGATGYYNYFGAAAGDRTQGYYSYELGSWHIVVLNSNCSQIGGCGAGSAQEQWLRADLAAHPSSCTLAYWHHPRFSFGSYSNDSRMQALWHALDEAGAEIVLSGHDHNYQRYAPQTFDGTVDREQGIRQFVVGTGGKSHTALGTPPPNVEAFNGDTSGILQLSLRANGYDWQFVPEAGKSFTDAGSGLCH